MKSGLIELSPGVWRDEKGLSLPQYRRAQRLLIQKGEVLGRCGDLLEQITAKDPAFDDSPYSKGDYTSVGMGVLEGWERELEATLGGLQGSDG